MKQVKQNDSEILKLTTLEKEIVSSNFCNKVCLPTSTRDVIIYSHNFKILFCLSSALEDEEYFNKLKNDWSDTFQDNQFVICRTAEELHALIKVSNEIYSDRCEYFLLLSLVCGASSNCDESKFL